jgi:hypothetical protein
VGVVEKGVSVAKPSWTASEYSEPTMVYICSLPLPCRPDRCSRCRTRVDGFSKAAKKAKIAEG